MRIVHFCAGLQFWNGMANTARQFVAEERAGGDDSKLTNNPDEIVDGIDVVMIHGAWLPMLWKVAKRAKAIGARLYIRPAGSYDPVRRAYHGWKKRLVSFFEHRMLRRADVVLATCKAEMEWIREYDPEIQNIGTTNLKRFFNLPQDAETSQLEFTISKPVHLLYLGRNHPLKGIEYLERAVAGQPDVELKIVSDAKGEELECAWQWCEVLVLPTLSENFGRVVAEALERGKYVITTDGAPVWGEGLGEEENECGSEGVKEGDVSIGYGGRLIYLKGFRDGNVDSRVRMLTKTIQMILTIQSTTGISSSSVATTRHLISPITSRLDSPSQARPRCTSR